jgi:hypothetical protein
MSINAIKKSIELANSGRRVKALELTRPDPEMAAVVSKLVAAPERPHYGKDGNRAPNAPQLQAFKNISQHTAQNIGDAETVMQILPDMDLARQILVSSILSPKDMMSTSLGYNAPEGLMAPEVLAAMIARARQHFEQDYKIKPLLSRMLDDMLFNTGSYPVAVIPENSIDDVINSPQRMAMEQFYDFVNPDGSMKPLGLLGPAIKTQPNRARAVPGLAMENFNDYIPDRSVDGRVTFEGQLEKPVDDSYLFVTDNINLLKIPQVNQKIRESRISDIFGLNKEIVALESERITMNAKPGAKKITDRELDTLLYKHRSYGHNAITSLKTQEQLARRTVGNPLILHLPSESVIPVYIPGTPEEQIGFFVLIDQDGNPVSRTSNTDYYQELTSRLNSNGNFPSAMLTKVRSMMSGFPSINANMTDYSVRYYQEIVEADLLSRLRNGQYGNGVALARREEVYRIMLSRTLAKQYTQLLFIPVELMTYMAFRFTPDGIGESLLDGMKILNSMRAMLMFSNVMAAVKNSVGRTQVMMNLDPDDPDPKKTIEIASHEIIRSRQQYFPLGMNSPTDLVDWLQRASLNFTYKNHPGLPELDIEFTEHNTQYVKPDTEMMEMLDKRAIMKTGLTPDNIDAAFHAEFATNIVQNNILLSKRIVVYQEKLEPQISDHARKVMMTSEHLRSDLRKILMDNFDSLNPDRHDQRQSAQDAKAAVADKQDDKSQAEFATAAKMAVQRQQEQGGGTTETPPGAEPNAQPAESGIPYGVIESGKEKKEDKQAKQQEQEDEVLKDHKKRFVVEHILQQFIRGFEITLPRPNSVTLENQMVALDTYSKALDQAIEAWLSEKFFTQEVVGEVANNVMTLKESIKAYYLRKWMAENGVMPELSELTTADEDGKPVLNVFDITKDHLESLVKSLTEQVVKLTVVKNASTDILDKTGAAAPAGGTEGGFGEGGTGEEGGGETPDFNAGGGFEETPAGGTEGGGGTETPPAEPTEPTE